MAAITRKEIVNTLLQARSDLNVACNNTVGEQQKHLTQQWANLNDMLAILACGDRQKLNQLSLNASHWKRITEKKT